MTICLITLKFHKMIAIVILITFTINKDHLQNVSLIDIVFEIIAKTDIIPIAVRHTTSSQ